MVGRCCLCEQPAVPRKSKYLCACCFNHSAAWRKQDVAALTEEREARLAQLEQALAAKEEQRRRDLQLLAASEGLRQARQHVAELEERLLAIRRRTAEVRAQTAERQVRLREAGHQLLRWERSAQSERSGQLAALGQNYLRSLDTLTREQRNRVVRRLLDIMPVKLMPPGSGRRGRGPEGQQPAGLDEERAVVMVCGLLLPDTRDDIQELVQLLPHLGSSLGYVALLLGTLSRFLQLPLLHSAHFQGSTSRLWQPSSFFDMKANPPLGALPLFPPMEAGHHHGGGSGSGGGGSGGGAGAGGIQALHRALYALQRSAGAVVFARLGPDAPSRVPLDWSPFAWLGGLCTMLAAEPRPGLSASRVQAVPHPAHLGSRGGHPHPSHTQHHLQHPGRLAASVVFGRVSPEQEGVGQSLLWPDDDGGDEEWDIIPRPSYGRMIPPPPSQPEDVEHWTQAMYPEQQQPGGGSSGSAHGSQGGSGQGGSTSGAAPAVASSPVDRIREAGLYMWKYVGGGSSNG